MFLMCAVIKNQTELVIYEACTTETFLKMLANGGMAVNCHMHLGQESD